MFSVESATSHGGVNAHQRLHRRDEPGGAESQRSSGVEQRTKSVGAIRAIWPDAVFGPAPVVNRMVRLHRSDHMLRAETLDLFRPQVLRMFDAEPAVAGAISLFDFGEHIEDSFVRLVTDRMNRDPQPGPVRI